MISPAELEALMKSDTPHAVLDLRERGAYQKRHIFRATSLPRRLLEQRLPLLVPALPTPIVLCDDTSALSALAVPTLRAMGYSNVVPLAGGLDAWVAEGRSTVQGVNTPSKVFGERVLHDLHTPEVTCLELDRRMAAGEDMVIVDTRTPEEYARGCLPGAWSMPGGELVLRLGELVKRPDTTIVVHCGGRTRSYLGAESVRKMGLPNPVVAVKNGTMGWVLDGLELERGASRWPPEPSPGGRALAAKVAKRVAADEGVPFVSPDEVKALLARRDRENVYILDVRTSEEYAASHIAGAVWAPGGQAVQATDEYVAVLKATVVLACDGFARSVMTAAWLRRMGFPNAVVLAGGLESWKQSGGAVESGHPAADALGPGGGAAARRHGAARPARRRAGAQRGHERRLRARPRPGRGVDLPEPARARARRDRARQDAPDRADLRRRRAVHPRRDHAGRHGLLRGACPRRRHARLGGGGTRRRGRAHAARGPRPTTSSSSRTRRAARRWRPISAGRRSWTPRAESPHDLLPAGD